MELIIKISKINHNYENRIFCLYFIIEFFHSIVFNYLNKHK
jgi:hypothetical protein